MAHLRSCKHYSPFHASLQAGVLAIPEWAAWLNGYAAGYWPSSEVQHSVALLRRSQFSPMAAACRARAQAPCYLPAPLPQLQGWAGGNSAADDALQTEVHVPADYDEGSVFRAGPSRFAGKGDWMPRRSSLSADLPPFQSASADTAAAPAATLHRVAASDPGAALAPIASTVLDTAGAVAHVPTSSLPSPLSPDNDPWEVSAEFSKFCGMILSSELLGEV